ncbi:dihydroneopterin 2',3'-cyclic phosphate phosphodiesterase, partial [Candidatus Bathyarchaeota archaeon]|nr:dihydroneopterin 2',3'-cyclic phosphate phosphodiesterase [Candidatus Bathyarchaeota archaeon]
MDERLRKLVEKIKDRSLREKVMELLENPTIEIEGKKFSGLPLESSPAGISRHHSYPGGFVEHVLASAEIALALCKVVRKIYRGKVNQDYVLAGVILHDIFKPLTYV